MIRRIEMMKYNYRRWTGGVLVFLLFLLFLNAGAALAQSSTNYTIQKWIVDQGGDFSQSTGYRLLDAIGQPSALGTAASTHYSVASGFLAGGVVSTGVEETGEPAISREFRLFQNYPNPFNPETTIQFSVKKSCRTVLKVYDLLGREVAQVVDKQHRPGVYEVRFDAAGLSSGLYFYRIQMGNFQAVRKMVVLE
jgi:hypothetical protein